MVGVSGMRYVRDVAGECVLINLCELRLLICVVSCV